MLCKSDGCKNMGTRDGYCADHFKYPAPPAAPALPKPGSRAFVQSTMEKVFEECRKLREAGQKEYAHDDSNAFANFDEDAEASGISREAVLMIFANKHWRGVRAWTRGHKSQREDVRGRINDMIVYLILLRSMADA